MVEFKNEKELDLKINKLKKITKITSIIRFILALNIIVWVICLITLTDYILYGILSAISILIFAIFLILTNKYYDKLSLENKLKKVYLNHYARRNLTFSGLLDEGRDFLDKEDYKLYDLDIFGTKSLFQYLSICKTKPAREMLANKLKCKDLNIDEDFRNSTNNLVSEDTLKIEASLLEFKNSAKTTSTDELNSVLNLKYKFKFLSFIPLLSLIGTIVYFILIFAISITPYPIIAFLIANFVLSKLCLANEIFDLDSFKYFAITDAYYKLSNTIISLDFKDKYYDEQKNIINNNLLSLKKVKNIYLSLSTRKNIIANIALNGLLAYDFWILLFYNKRTKSINDLSNLFNSIAKIEVVASFANIGIDNDIYTIPTNSKTIIAKDMYHPLVKNCIKNDFNLSGGVVLTGSNMSGKTTFMRTLGINQILFNSSSIVLASSFSSDTFDIYTSLRANDMLSEGISTFYAEILRMKKANEALNTKSLILIDEIFKGTNAHDRIEASFKVIDKFNEYNKLFIISTHDFELCDAKNILNYHFNEQYNDDKISFDYKIKEGKSETTNALYLLKMSGII